MRKKDEILKLSAEELKTKLAELMEESRNLQMQKATHQLSNPMRIRIVRRNIATVRTLLTEFDMGVRTAPSVL